MIHTLEATLFQIMHDEARPKMTLNQLDERLGSKNLITRFSALANRLSTAGTTPKAKDREPKDRFHRPGERTVGNCRILNLGLSTRIITSGLAGGLDFEAFLQILSANGWVTIVCYEYRNGHARRKMYYADGQSRLLMVDLPRSVVLEMAQADFQRNWPAYFEEFRNEPTSHAKLAFPA